MEFIKKVKKLSIIAIVTSIIMGLLFIIFPSQCIKYISLAIGVALIAFGVYGVIMYFVNKGSTFSLIMGLIVLVTGVVVCAKYKAIISVIVVLFGIYILSTGLFNLFTGIKVLASRAISGWVSIVLSIITVVLGTIAVFKSAQLTEAIVQLMGIALVVYAVVDVITYFQVKKDLKDSTIIDTDIFNGETLNGDVIESEATIVEEEDE